MAHTLFWEQRLLYSFTPGVKSYRRSLCFYKSQSFEACVIYQIYIMDPVQIYGLAAGGIFVTCLLYCASSYVYRWIQDRTLFLIFKYLIYPFLIKRSFLFSPLSRWHALLTVIYWSGTAVCNIVGVSTIAEAGNRAGSLAALHLIPLLFASRAGFAAELLGLSLQTYMRLHKSFGFMALLQSLIHIIIFLSSHALQTGDHLQFYGLLVRFPKSRFFCH